MRAASGEAAAGRGVVFAGPLGEALDAATPLVENRLAWRGGTAARRDARRGIRRDTRPVAEGAPGASTEDELPEETGGWTPGPAVHLARPCRWRCGWGVRGRRPGASAELRWAVLADADRPRVSSGAETLCRRRTQQEQAEAHRRDERGRRRPRARTSARQAEAPPSLHAHARRSARACARSIALRLCGAAASRSGDGRAGRVD